MLLTGQHIRQILSSINENDFPEAHRLGRKIKAKCSGCVGNSVKRELFSLLKDDKLKGFFKTFFCEEEFLLYFSETDDKKKRMLVSVR